MNLGVQYYRAPFPESKYWEADLRKIRESGLNTVQFWVLWGWVESRPDRFEFDDYDRLMELAEKNGLGVVLSTVAEIQPHWIHRVAEDSEMIDNRGNRIVSSGRCECNFGLTPGGCTDHPVVWERMSRFLAEVAARYRDAPCLKGWDAWNELRWNEHADALVCFCPHTLKRFRNWLDERYGGLDGLNSAWKRRYGCWEEVMPGRCPDRPYAEMMAFEHFITCRGDRHAWDRCEVIKSIDNIHPVTVHGGRPTPLHPGCATLHPIDRGNDWFFADRLDGIGCSSFPKWSGMDDAEFGARIEFVASAARGREVWLSELQGGRAGVGFGISAPVDARSQQRWIWNGLACGASTILLWCWRDEVFGRESGEFGLSGDDGLAEERLAAMRITGGILAKYPRLFASWRPAAPRVGVMFSPQSYYLHWAQEGTAARAVDALKGYTRALVRKSIPYLVVEERHLEVLDGLRILFLPRFLVMDAEMEERLGAFVRNGGVLFCESECGAFSGTGFYRYPADRFFAGVTGRAETGRRHLEQERIPCRIGERRATLFAAQWATPLESGERDGLIVELPVGKGRIVHCGTCLGERYERKRYPDFEEFLEDQVRRAGVKAEVEILSPAPDGDSFFHIKYGDSEYGKILFLFFPDNAEEAELRLPRDFFPSGGAVDLISGGGVRLIEEGDTVRCAARPSELRVCVIADAVSALKQEHGK